MLKHLITEMTGWSAGKYGNKVKKALEMQAKGINILLMKEADFFDALVALDDLRDNMHRREHL